MPNALTDRLEPCARVARTLGVDAVALVPGPNLESVVPHPFSGHERPFLLVLPGGEGASAALVPDLELGSWNAVGFEGAVFDWRDQDCYAAAFDTLLSHLGIGSLAVEGQAMRVFIHHALLAAQPGLRIVDAEPEISALRRIKTPAEIDSLRAAIDVFERALAQTLDGVRAGQSVQEVERSLVVNLFAEGADALAFGPIVATGDNLARPHARARADDLIAPGDALLLDFAAQVNDLCVDITRAVFAGHADDEAREVYDTVLCADRRAFAHPETGAHAVDEPVTGVLEPAPDAERIRTRTNHGLGRDVREAPCIMHGNHAALGAGMVFTDAPGLYAPGRFGVRIEDDVRVPGDGCVPLTQFPKDLTVLPC